MDESRVPGRRITYTKGSTIYSEGDLAAAWYEIEDGVVRTCRYLSSGGRHVTGFFRRGQIFGAEAAHYLATAEAVTEVTLIARSRRALDDFGATGAAATSHPLSLALQNAERRVHLLVLKGAAARVAGFLLVTAETVRGRNCVHLPMLRADIADYLAIDVATVSRILSRFLSQRLLIPLEKQAYLIGDIHLLEAVASGDESALVSEAGPSRGADQPQDESGVPPSSVPEIGGRSAYARYPHCGMRKASRS